MNTRQRTILNRIKSTTPYSDHLIIRDGWMWRANPDYVTGFPTDIPDCIVDYDDIKQLLPRLKKATYTIEEDQLVIREESRTYRFILIEESDAERFIPDVSGLQGETFDADLHKRIRQYASTDDLRPAMTHVYYGPKGTAATDAHRMYYDLQSTYSNTYLVHRDVANLLIGDEYQMSVDANETDSIVYIWNEDQVLVQKGYTHRFPNFEAVIPDNSNKFTVNRKEVIDLVTEAKIFSPKQINYPVWITPTTIEVKTESPSFEGKIDMGFSATLNAELLLGILKYSDEEEVVFYINDKERRPILIDDNFLIVELNIR